MTEAIVLSALLVAWIGLGARLSVEADVLDVLLLSGACIGIGHMIHGVFQ
jgi:hypothetical protein